MEAVARAPADGHTLITISSTNAVNATLYDKLNFNFIPDIAPVAAIMRVPIVLEANRGALPEWNLARLSASCRRYPARSYSR